MNFEKVKINIDKEVKSNKKQIKLLQTEYQIYPNMKTEDVISQYKRDNIQLKKLLKLLNDKTLSYYLDLVFEID